MAKDLAFDPSDRRLTPTNSDVTENITMPSTGRPAGSYTRPTALALSDGDMSICPKGWKLPIGGADSVADSYSKLLSTYNFTGGDVATLGFNQLKSTPFNYGATFNTSTKHPAGFNIFLNYYIGWTTSSETVFAIGDDYSSGTVTSTGQTVSQHRYVVSANLGKTLYSKYQGYNPEVFLPDYAAVRCVAK